MFFVRKIHKGLILGLLAASAMLASNGAQAKPEFAVKEKVNCVYCHVVPGGPRNFRGVYYGARNHSFANFDEVYEAKMAGAPVDSKGADAKATVADYPNNEQVAPALNFALKDIDGKTVNLARYQGDVILVVNVASKCGNTPQYASLEKLYDKYKAKGFTVLGFPANDFGMQEPGTEKEIKEFCSATYKVKFPMFSKIVVKGEGQAPLYKFLTDKKTNPKFGDPIEWNFAKFLINRKGEIVARFKASDDPVKHPEIEELIAKEVEVPKEDKSASAK